MQEEESGSRFAIRLVRAVRLKARLHGVLNAHCLRCTHRNKRYFAQYVFIIVHATLGRASSGAVLAQKDWAEAAQLSSGTTDLAHHWEPPLNAHKESSYSVPEMGRRVWAGVLPDPWNQGHDCAVLGQSNQGLARQ